MSSAQEFVEKSENDSLLKCSDDGESELASSHSSTKVDTTFTCYKREGKVTVLGEWKSAKKVRRVIVIGPDWPCLLITYLAIVIPSVLLKLYVLEERTETIIFYILLGICLISLSSVCGADAGMVRKYRYARTRYWTYCDHCESFRPPGSVHCSTCQVCIKGYDHHCPWTGKCIGESNIIVFKIFIVSLCWLIIFCLAVGILKVVHIGA